LHSEAATD